MSSRRRRPPVRLPAADPVVGPTDPCPCGEAGSYADGCGRLHAGSSATTPVELMRSRYSAFVVRDAAYLLRTWAGAHRPPDIDFDRDLRWTGLDIVGTTGGTAFHSTGTVEFRAHFEHRGSAGVHEESSRFVRENGQWVCDRAVEPGE